MLLRPAHSTLVCWIRFWRLGLNALARTSTGARLSRHEEGGASLELAAELALFLASSESDGISGRLISAVWDDWHKFPVYRERIQKSDVFTLRRIVPQDRGWEA